MLPQQLHLFRLPLLPFRGLWEASLVSIVAVGCSPAPRCNKHIRRHAVASLFERLHEDENAAHDADKREESPLRQLLAGGCSLAATGLRMSLTQNRGAALSVEPEIDHVLSCFTAESSIDRAAPAKLWDGSDWHRPVMDKTRALTVHKPWFGCFSCFSGGHIPEMHKATVQGVFGLVCPPAMESHCCHSRSLLEASYTKPKTNAVHGRPMPSIPCCARRFNAMGLLLSLAQHMVLQTSSIKTLTSMSPCNVKLFYSQDNTRKPNTMRSFGPSSTAWRWR